MENFIGIEEAAKIIGVTKLTLWRWIQKDIDNKKNDTKNRTFKCPKYYQIGSRYKFYLKDLNDFIGKTNDKE